MSSESLLPAPASPPSLGRKLLVPVVVLLVLAVVLALPGLWVHFDGPPEFLITMMMGQWLAVAVAALILLAWWTFFAAFPLALRLGVLGVLGVLFAGFFFSVRDVQFSQSQYGMYPVYTFFWHPQQSERFSAAPKAEVADAVNPDADGARFARYRGHNADGKISSPLALAASWDAAGPAERWRRPVGGGYSGAIIVGNVVYTLELRETSEVIACYDRATGTERWIYSYPAYHHDVMGHGPRATPAYADGEVFSYGALGDLVCVDAKTGSLKWRRQAVEESKAKKVQWGMSSSPLIVDDLVVVEAGIDPDVGGEASLAAYERTSGKRVWAAGRNKAGYSSPQLATIAGTRLILMFNGESLAGHDPQSGAVLWSHPWITFAEQNTIQPLVFADGRVFISSEVQNGSVMLQVSKAEDQWSVREVWKNSRFCSRFSNPVTDGTSIYGMSNGRLTCLDAATGKRQWAGDNVGTGQLLLVNNLLVVSGAGGEVCLVAADPAEYRMLARKQVLTGKTWNTPALAGQDLVVRHDSEMALLSLPLAK